MFTHFIAINVAYTHIIGDAHKLVGFRPDNASLTIIASDGQNLSLITAGEEATTQIM